MIPRGNPIVRVCISHTDSCLLTTAQLPLMRGLISGEFDGPYRKSDGWYKTVLCGSGFWRYGLQTPTFLLARVRFWSRYNKV